MNNTQLRLTDKIVWIDKYFQMQRNGRLGEINMTLTEMFRLCTNTNATERCPLLNMTQWTTVIPEISLPNTCIAPPLTWVWMMKCICIPLLVIFGTTGNTLSFLVLGTSHYQKRYYSHYLRALAIFDSLVLLIELVAEGNKLGYYLDCGEFPIPLKTWSCKLGEFCRHTICLMSSWLIVSFTIDR